jgi:putative flavoprotein involved in K+ transport
VDRLSRDDGRFVVAAGDRRWEADNAVVAMSTFQVPRVPVFAADLRPEIVQLHSVGYRNPSQLQQGGVLVVGAGNSGAEIALELAGRHPTWLAGKESGHVPFRIEGTAARYIFQPLLFRVIGHRVLTVDTPIGRRLRPRLVSHAAPLVRVKPKDLAGAGVRRVPRVVGTRDGHPLMADQRALEVTNVIWCTGSGPDFSWIDLPVFGENEHEPVHHRGVVASQPGLYFVGLSFLYAMSSGFLPGVDRDAEHIVQAILARAGRTSRRLDPAAGNGVPRPIRAG